MKYSISYLQTMATCTKVALGVSEKSSDLWQHIVGQLWRSFIKIVSYSFRGKANLNFDTLLFDFHSVDQKLRAKDWESVC